MKYVLAVCLTAVIVYVAYQYMRSNEAERLAAQAQSEYESQAHAQQAAAALAAEAEDARLMAEQAKLESVKAVISAGSQADSEAPGKDSSKIHFSDAARRAQLAKSKAAIQRADDGAYDSQESRVRDFNYSAYSNSKFGKERSGKEGHISDDLLIVESSLEDKLATRARR